MITRFRMTIQGIMVAVVFVAGILGFRSYLERWEARRVVMYQQRDVTRLAMAELPVDIAAAELSSSEFRRSGDDRTYTARWSEQLEAWVARDGGPPTRFRATVSGANGHFSLPPIEIRIESDGSRLEGLWLDRLLRAYGEKGWRSRVIRVPRSPLLEADPR